MEIVETIFTQTALKLSTFFLILATIICPGFLCLYIFRDDIFSSLDIFQICLLSCSVCFPIWLINFYFISQIAIKKELKSQNPRINLLAIITSIITLVVLYFPLLFNFFFEISFRKVFQLTFAVELALIIYFIFFQKNKGK